MSDIRALLNEAESAALAIERIKSEIESYKRRLEALKGDMDAAKAALDQAYVKCEEGGLPKAKARKAVEEIIRVLAEAGVLEVNTQSLQPAADAGVQKPAAARRPRRKAAESAGEAQAQESAASDGPAANAPSVEPLSSVPQPDPSHTPATAAVPQEHVMIEDSASVTEDHVFGDPETDFGGEDYLADDPQVLEEIPENVWLTGEVEDGDAANGPHQEPELATAQVPEPVPASPAPVRTPPASQPAEPQQTVQQPTPGFRRPSFLKR